MDNDVLSDKFEGIINTRFGHDFHKKDSEYGLTTVKLENTACLKTCLKGNKPEIVKHFFPDSNPAKVMGILKAKGVVWWVVIVDFVWMDKLLGDECYCWLCLDGQNIRGWMSHVKGLEIIFLYMQSQLIVNNFFKIELYL